MLNARQTLAFNKMCLSNEKECLFVFFCLWQEEEWDIRMEGKDKNKVNGRKEKGGIRIR